MNAILLGGCSLGVAAACTFLLRDVDDNREDAAVQEITGA
jgi:hypothetical protein